MYRHEQSINESEPTYDVVSLELLEQQEVALLVEALAQYCVSLEKQIIELRSWVNKLMPDDNQPFLDLHSDLYESFYDYGAYSKFEQQLKVLE